jgi:hypothetical protein
MPEVVFMYVFDVKTGPGGTKIITPPSRSKKSFPAPETLAAAGFSATGKGRRLTFKISLTNNVDPKLTAADIKKIQESLNRKLVFLIASYRRVLSESLKVTVNVADSPLLIFILSLEIKNDPGMLPSSMFSSKMDFIDFFLLG